MRTAIVSQATAIMLACAAVCSPQAAAKGVLLETTENPRCHWSDAVDPWLANPPLPERLTLPEDRPPPAQRTEPGQGVVAAPAVLAKIDGSRTRRDGSPSGVSARVPRHSLLSVLCLLIV
ncbi:MAG: hypothetical protein RBS72_19630 [Sedimentisphaerales bacterium]|jgi:hypothetical protein|nr:hypothetical protein [Sedimentisphaerales bacterium]NLZ07236.1 hypothetical protein [Phycisphaerae bacterium]HNY80564.1 hypothetical protein [Sedimentisphaerales bacterium]HOC65333.1 hypothetical protein [Sedimentisphaerales bacterium]HOH66330.1 hypothetical protein [Sedimentisphaerales bacterium]